MQELQSRELIIVGNSSDCGSFTSCSTCVGTVTSDCAWCSTDSTCIDASSRSGTCDSELFGSCDTNYYTIIFVTVLAAMFCICCATCYLRRLHRLREQQMIDIFSPLLPQRAREMLFRNSLLGEGEMEWMCIICGFDNKPRNKDCIMCGTSHQFSMDYKTEKKEQRRQKHQKWKLSMLARKNNTRTGNNKQPQAMSAPHPDVDANYEQNNNVDIPIPADAQITTISMSLRNFDINQPITQQSTAILTHEQREEAINYRRLNILTLRQKSARRRKMWQRERDPITNEFVWRRVPIKQIKVGSAPFGYTPRPSISGRVETGNNVNNNSNNNLNHEEQSSFLSFLSFRPPPPPPPSSSSSPPATAAANTSNNHNTAFEDLLSAVRSPHATISHDTDNVSVVSYSTSSPLRRIPSQRSRHDSKDSFGDSVLASHSPGFTSVFDEEGGLEWHRVDSGAPVAKSTFAATVARFPWSNSTAANTITTQSVQQQQGQLRQLLNNVVGSDEEQGQAATTSPLHLTSPYNPDERQPLITSYSGVQCPVDLAAIAAWTFKEKQLWFLDRMSELQKPWTDGFVRIEVRRQKLLDDSHRAWSQLRPQDYHKWMRYQFANEPGIDAGGLEREWFSLVIDEIFSPATGLFLQCGVAGSGVYHVNPISGAINANHLSFFRFIGRLLGKALMEQQSIKANLSLPLRKQIIGTPVTFSDLEFVDEQLYRNLLWLNNANDEDIESMCLDFSISYTAANQTVTFDLKPNGTDITVTKDNREEYLMLRLKHRLLDSIKPQLEHLLTGLYEIIPPELLSVFDYQELDLLLCGVSGPELDLQDWIRHTEYMGEYRRLGARHPVIHWFWLCVEAMTSEERVRLLQFTTGCARLPVMGFKALQSSDGRYRKFNIQSIMKQDSIYPRAHTCFNKLDLPMYDSKEEMEGFLSFVINISPTGFHME